MTFKTSNLEELILPLRIQIGDTGGTPSYSDETLHEILRVAVNGLMRRWNSKYYVDNNGVVQRNTTITFEFSSPPVIQRADHRAIVLMASIMIKGGKKFTEVSQVVSWRDDEVSYSNIEGARQRSTSLEDDVTELNSILPLPMKKLARALYGDLPGWTQDFNQ
jgi:hypothetical protein